MAHTDPGERDSTINQVIHQREAVRAVVITPDAEVLLEELGEPGGPSFWVTPGGGIRTGETAEAALRRELAEELGLEQFEIGPLLLRRRHTFSWLGRRIRQSEQLFAVQVERFEPRFGDPVEAHVFRSFRWWTLDELRDTTESVTPASLANLVADYLRRGAPAVVELEVREDPARNNMIP